MKLPAKEKAIPGGAGKPKGPENTGGFTGAIGLNIGYWLNCSHCLSNRHRTHIK